jgi:hypothetical protein
MDNRTNRLSSSLAGHAAALFLGTAIALLGSLLITLAFAATARAGPPTHPSLGPVLEGLNHACGVAVDSQGDLYASSAGESKLNVYDSEHDFLASIPDSNIPCGLAVDSEGRLYVSERGSGNVVRYTPDAYPLTAAPAYGSPQPIDVGGEAKGISVDPADDRLYVAEGDRVSVYSSEGKLGIDEEQRVSCFECDGGSYRLRFGGEETEPIASEGPAAEVEAKLQALASIGAGNVSVTNDGREHLVHFEGALARTDVELLGVEESELTGPPTRRLIREEKIKGWSGRVGEGVLTEATGVAAYTSPTGDRRLFVADARGLVADELSLFSGPSVVDLKLRREITGAATPHGSFEFVAAGAYLAIDPGNQEEGGSGCASVEEQACTAGHLLLYDAGHAALDEFEASGEYLDQMSGPALTDAEPSGIAIDRAGGAGDGTIYIGVGSGTGAKVLAFGPLPAPARPLLEEPLSHLLEGAEAIATDDRGDVYVAAGSFIHVYSPLGNELTSFEDPHPPLSDLALDSKGNVYVLEEENGREVHYYAPNPAAQYPPQPGTTYTRHEPAVAKSADFPSESQSLRSIAVDPGPGEGRDRLFVASIRTVRVYGPAKEGSGVENPDFGAGLLSGPNVSIAVEGASVRNDGQTTVYVAAAGSSTIKRLNGAGDEIVGRINGAGCPQGEIHLAPQVAVDQANGHLLEFQPRDEAAREYDSSGTCVAEFGHFTDLSVPPYGIAVDSSCSLHIDPETGEAEPLDETTTPTCAEYDPADGNTYVAFDDTAPGSHDVTAFGPISYGEPPKAETEPPSELGNGEARLNGALNPRGFEVEACTFEYLTEDEYEANLDAEEPPFDGATAVPCAESGSGIGVGGESVPVHATASLDTEAHNCVRLVAINKYGTSEGEALCFGPPHVEAQPAQPIGYTELTVRGKVDPAGLSTHYRCQYGNTPGEYDHVASPPPLAPSAGESEVECVLTDLAEGTAYHVRIVAENEAGVAAGADQEVVTLARRAAEPCPNAEYRTGLSAKLPDCRAYELVTPAETNGLSPRATDASDPTRGFDHWPTSPHGAGGEQSLTYITSGTLPGFEGNGAVDGYRAARGTGEHPLDGWQSSLFGPTYAQAQPGLGKIPPLVQGISSDQSYSIWRIDPVDSSAELNAGSYLHTPGGFETLGRGDLGEDLDAIGRYLSPNGAHVIFSSSEHLEPTAPPSGLVALYDRAAGAAHAEVISLDSKDSPFSADATFMGTNEAGTAVVFGVGGALYERRGGSTVEVAAAPATFAGISEDGRRVFYVASANGETAGALFVCDVGEGPCAGSGAHSPTQIAAAGIFANVSADGSHAFFSSEEALTGVEENENAEAAELGARNLYAWDGASTRFVARLAPSDFAQAAFGGISAMNMKAWTRAVGRPGPETGRAFAPTRSTPSGEVFAFQSHARLTAYANDGVGEIYLYDSSAPAGERLTCPSCDPSGASPGADALFQDIGGNTATVAHIVVPNLTEDGKALFFTSRDRLLPEDANSAADIYEWRARGARWGGAPEAVACDRAGGCLALISSGQGERDSYLYGMSADGRDVFFRTLEKLLGADVAGSASIYDAREGGGVPEAVEAAPCQGDACQGQGAEAPSLPVPLSASNGQKAPQPAAPCRKGRHRHKGHCVKKRHQSRHRHHRRTSHKGGARR